MAQGAPTVATTTVAFDSCGPIPPTRVTLAYRIGLTVVSLAMVLLPVIYLAIIALVGRATWWHLTTNTYWLAGGGSKQLQLIAYLAPGISGVAVMFFMVKPLLARPAKGRDPLQITAADQPELFEFIHEICRQVGAPVPRRVNVDCQINASASLMRGVLRRDLVLTVGLPLVAGLSVRQFGGVLAHEFGHFTQGGGLRLSVVVRSINFWFARVVYERDYWDEALADWSSRVTWQLKLVLYLALLAIALSRKILLGLMWVGHAISCFMMRQMEYDADSYEVKLAGSVAFAQTFARLRDLNQATALAMHDLGDGLRRGAIPGNLPMYVAHRASTLVRASGSDAVRDQKTRLFDSHPSDADRLHVAADAGVPGVLVGGDAPAGHLFADFEDLCSRVTRHHYEHELGLDTDALALLATKQAVSRMRARESQRQAIIEFFAGGLSTLRPLRVSLPAETGAALIEHSHTSRATMQALGGDAIATQYRELEKLAGRARQVLAVQTLMNAGFTTINAASFGLSSATPEELARVQAGITAARQRINTAVAAFEDAAVRRLSSGLARAVAAAREASSNDAGRAATDLVAIADALNALTSAAPSFAALESLHAALVILGANATVSPNTARMAAYAGQVQQRAAALLQQLQNDLSRVPLTVVEQGATAASYCGLSAEASEEDFPAIDARMWALYFDLLGRIVQVTLESESADQPVLA